MPIKWMSSDTTENALVELGTFDKVIFEHLDDLVAMGINCIELLPIEDTPQTLNWGYGTRFFFAPDYDLGAPVDAKFFVKYCHQRGVRVILDVVMNMYAPQCPLTGLAQAWFNAPSTPGRQDWGQELFKFDAPAYGDYYAARQFLCEMAEFWVSQYHVDGYPHRRLRRHWQLGFRTGIPRAGNRPEPNARARAAFLGDCGRLQSSLRHH